MSANAPQPQAAFDFVSAPAYRAVARREYVLRKLLEHRDRFKYVDVAWLQKNWAIWEAFEYQATRVWNAGRRHFGARRIGEHIRYETALAAEPSDGFKVNDHVWPDLARLYVVVWPERDELFEFRGRTP